MSKIDSRPKSSGQRIFEGTDTVDRNRTIAIQRVVEAHQALELQHQAEVTTETQRNDCARISSDRLGLDFDAIDLPEGEVRAFRYFLRKWDHDQSPDPEFDQAVRETQQDFEEAALKHFFRRVALWNESEETLKAAKSELEKRVKRDKKRDKDSMLGRLWIRERGSQEHSIHDELKQVTTREGLAQLLYTLMHDPTAPLAPELVAECTKAVKKWKYGITS
jgi:exonuclease VII small subunit